MELVPGFTYLRRRNGLKAELTGAHTHARARDLDGITFYILCLRNCNRYVRQWVASFDGLISLSGNLPRNSCYCFFSYVVLLCIKTHSLSSPHASTALACSWPVLSLYHSYSSGSSSGGGSVRKCMEWTSPAGGHCCWIQPAKISAADRRRGNSAHCLPGVEYAPPSSAAKSVFSL